MPLLTVNIAVNTDTINAQTFREDLKKEFDHLLEKIYARIELERPDTKLVVPRIVVP